MKKAFYILSLLVIAVLTSCGGGGSDDPSGGGGYTSKSMISVNPTSIMFESEGGSKTFTVTCTNVSSWTISGYESWVHVNVTAGSSNSETVTVTVDANTSSSSRTSKIIVSGGGLSKEITITQNPPTDDISVSSSSMTFGVDGGEKTVSITCKLDWNITDYPSWVKVSSSSGTGNSSFTITVLPNDTGTSRTGTITIKGTTSSVTISITQEGGTAPTVNNFSVSSSGSYSFSITASPAATEYGVCYSTSNQTPTVDDSKASTSGQITNQTVTGQVSELASKTIYYCRAYAKNAVGTTYSSNVVTITTTNETPGSDDNIPPSAAKKQ